jgi:hypothetical protein
MAHRLKSSGRSRDQPILLYEMRAREGGGGQWLTLNPLDPNGVAQRAIPVYDAPKPPAVDGDVAWMIECSTGFTGWWDGHEPPDCRFFNTDPNKGKRFSSKEEAEQVIKTRGNSCMISTDHKWLDGFYVAPPVAQPPDAKPAQQPVELKTVAWAFDAFSGDFDKHARGASTNPKWAAAWKNDSVRELVERPEFPLYAIPPDAIPREIHERLMRDAKAQALRDFRDWLIGETRSAGILAQDVVDALERRARFHEQSAPGGK